MPAQRKPRKAKPIYTGVFLTPESKTKLIKAVPLREEHVNVFAHHMTIWHASKKTTPLEKLPLGELVDLRVLGYSFDEFGVAAAVQPPFALDVANKVPHITIATSVGVKPFYSNRLLKTQGVQFSLSMTVRGKLGWFDGRDVRFDLP